MPDSVVFSETAMLYDSHLPTGSAMLGERYCRARFDSDSLTTGKIETKIIAIVRLRNRNYARQMFYMSCLSIYGIIIVRSLSF